MNSGADRWPAAVTGEETERSIDEYLIRREERARLVASGWQAPHCPACDPGGAYIVPETHVRGCPRAAAAWGERHRSAREADAASSAWWISPRDAQEARRAAGLASAAWDQALSAHAAGLGPAGVVPPGEGAVPSAPSVLALGSLVDLGASQDVVAAQAVGDVTNAFLAANILGPAFVQLTKAEKRWHRLFRVARRSRAVRRLVCVLSARVRRW